jgi:hypothetical protein
LIIIWYLLWFNFNLHWILFEHTDDNDDGVDDVKGDVDSDWNPWIAIKIQKIIRYFNL